MAETIEETTYYDRNDAIVPAGLADKYAVKGKTVVYSRADGHHIGTQWFVFEGAEDRPPLPADEPEVELETEPKERGMAKVQELEAAVKAAKTPAEENAAIAKVVDFIGGKR